jgi:hypothetical protein
MLVDAVGIAIDPRLASFHLFCTAWVAAVFPGTSTPVFGDCPLASTLGTFFAASIAAVSAELLARSEGSFQLWFSLD